MEDQRRIPIVAVIILIGVLLAAIGFFLFRKQSLVSPLPEENSVKVIFTSPPPTNTPLPTAVPSNTPTPTKKPAAKASATPTPKTATPTATTAPVNTPTPGS